jgi:predicted nucleotidyltransferase
MSITPILSPEIDEYISQVAERYGGIESVWLVGSRANGRASEESDWDFIVFGGTELFNSLKSDESVHRENVDFLIVEDDGDSFSRPWGRRKRGSLSSWKWTTINDHEATYIGTKWIPDEEQVAKGRDMGDLRSFKLQAIRVRP